PANSAQLPINQAAREILPSSIEARHQLSWFSRHIHSVIASLSLLFRVKWRERGVLACEEILRFAQNDRGGAAEILRFAQNDRSGAVRFFASLGFFASLRMTGAE